jgi:DNA helicase-2/ATP-dependent DNA helicase PcrA
VVHEGGPLLIVAGAGSGKTRVLTRRMAYLMAERGISPGEILAITFTNKAAGEMAARAAALTGSRARGMWVMTFHSACVRFCAGRPAGSATRPPSRSTTRPTRSG